MTKTATGAEGLALRSLGLLEGQDVRDRVRRLLGAGSDPRAAITLTVHRVRADGRAVAEYESAGRRVFAKLYPDVAGRHAYEIHSTLHENGFGAGSPHQVPEPLAYVEDQRILVLSPAAGVRLAGTEAHDWRAFEEGVARAARWLAALHGSGLQVGPREPVADGRSRLARRAEKAIVARPDLEAFVRYALSELDARRPSESGRSVATHGRFHPGHVFVAPSCITAVDLDRAAMTEPCKDVAQFLHGLRAIGAKTGFVDDAVEGVCRRFLAEYARPRPASAGALAYHLSFSVLWTLLGLAFKDRPARPGWEQRLDFFSREFEAAPSRAAQL